MLDILFQSGRMLTTHEAIKAIEARIKTIEHWQGNQSADLSQGTYYLPNIKDFLYPFNGVISHYTRTYGPPWGPNNAWREWTDQAYRMGAQILIEESEAKDAPWVRLWIGNASEPEGATSPELVVLREWLDANPDGGRIPQLLLDAINRKDPHLERKPRNEWLKIPEGTKPYSALPEPLRHAHSSALSVKRLLPVLANLIQVSEKALETTLRQQPPVVTHAKSMK